MKENSAFNYIKNLFQDFFKIKDTNDYDFTLETSTNPIVNKSKESDINKLTLEDQTIKDNSPKKVFPMIDLNLEYMKVRYNSMINSDIQIREFTLNARNRQYKAFLVYIDGMTDQDIMNNYILKPLMLKNTANSFDGNQNKVISEVVTNNITVRKIKKFDIAEYISSCLLPQNTLEKTSSFNDLVNGINAGNCALFIDTLDVAFNIEVKGFEKRSLDSPNNEIVIRGSQVGFTENLRTNTSLLRRYVNNENLIIESTTLGAISQTPCAICYLKNVANSDLIAEVKYRVNNLKIDYLISSGQLEQLIQDNENVSLPQLIPTERPDRATNMLFEGRVVVIVNGSPYVLIAPATFADFMNSPEDLNVKHQYSNFIRVLRMVALFISILLPGFYMAITNFHQELIPTELLFAIVASRESVPFPILFEILVMEFSFEIIREASIRVPNPIGPTLGIVGALILGQAAVDASIVSPILIIIVSLTAICSFAIPDLSLGFHARISRFIYIVLGAITGFLGIASGLIVHTAIICSMKSFGVSYIEPTIFTNTNSGKGIILKPAWQREDRSEFLKTKRPKEQPKISMTWKYKY